MASFGAWSEKIHSDSEQQKRQKSALDKKLTPMELNPEKQTGVFKGSKESYKTTLSECQCVDFGRRKKPCKHMYRLAMELGKFPGIDNAKRVSPDLLGRYGVIEKVFSIISSLPKEDQESFAYLCYKCGNNNEYSPQRINKELAAELQELDLITIQKVLRVNADVVLNDWLAGDAHRIHRAFMKNHPDTPRRSQEGFFISISAKIE